jgi:uncharacterized membrane protein YoaK (UPF0700 family)
MNRMDRSRRRFAMALAGMAGFVDAAGYLSAGGYFVSFMSGNTTRLGVALGTGAGAALPALLIAGFVAGVTAGALVALRAGPWRKPAVLALVALPCWARAPCARRICMGPCWPCWFWRWARSTTRSCAAAKSRSG